MLNHGAGRVLLIIDFELLLIVISVIILVLLTLAYVLWKVARYRLMSVGAIFAAFGGMFGFSTLAVGTPVYISLFIMLFMSCVRFNGSEKKIFSDDL